MLFLATSASVRGQNFDVHLYEDLHVHRNTSLDGAMNALSQSTYPVALAVPALQCIAGLAGRDKKQIEYAVQSATGLILNTVLVYGLKYTVRRDRPYVQHPEYIPYEYDTSPSFPSGHTSFAFATATQLSIQYRRWYVVAPAFLYAGAVGYARVHLGQHYPTDVLAGALVGAASAWVSYKGNVWLRGLWKKRTEKKLED